MKAANLRKERRLRQKQNIYNLVPSSSFRNNHKEEWFYSYRRDKERLKEDKKRNLAAAERPLMLPPLAKRTFPEHTSKRADEFAPFAKTTTNRKMFPKYLPKIETRKAELHDSKAIKESIDPVSRSLRNAEKTVNKKLPPLRTRPVQPTRAAISTSATLRGLVMLDLEEQFIFRFRLSNYDVKDINTATLNEPVG